MRYKIDDLKLIELKIKAETVKAELIESALEHMQENGIKVLQQMSAEDHHFICSDIKSNKWNVETIARKYYMNGVDTVAIDSLAYRFLCSPVRYKHEDERIFFDFNTLKTVPMTKQVEKHTILGLISTIPADKTQIFKMWMELPKPVKAWRV